MPALSQEQALSLLATARVARLGTIGPGGAPHLVPVTFALARPGGPAGAEPGGLADVWPGGPADAGRGAVLYTGVDAKPKSTRLLRRLDNIRRDPRVAVLADHYAEDWATLWWVRADGTAAVLDAPEQMERPLRLLAARYPQYAEQAPAGPVIEISIGRFTGWAATGS